jgi:hypothetical protein
MPGAEDLRTPSERFLGGRSFADFLVLLCRTKEPQTIAGVLRPLGVWKGFEGCGKDDEIMRREEIQSE